MYWSIEDIWWGILITGGLIILFAFAGAISYHFIRRIDSPPPKVITIHDSGLTSAQQAYIHQCEQNSQDVNGDNNSAIPNVEANPWTCTYAH